VRVAVFASGGGTNLQALLDACRPPAPATVALVVSDKPTAGALERARSADAATVVLEDHRDATEILDTLDAHAIDFVVLAGYLKLVPADVVARFEGRMINIHPALLPSFGGKGMYGRRVHDAVLQSGAGLSGPTVHLVSSEYDRGRILAQWPVPVRPDDTPDTLAARVLTMEHQLLPAVVLAAARHGHAVRLLASGNGFTIEPGDVHIHDALAPANSA
jgi:formyltetrahydrofolate-dependent phosphoribosylglycinamide formyltransferase